MIGKQQIEKLKLLGYMDTVEDGALLQHPSLGGMSAYVWRDQSFDAVLANFPLALVTAERQRIASSIRIGDSR